MERLARSASSHVLCGLLFSVDAEEVRSISGRTEKVGSISERPYLGRTISEQNRNPQSGVGVPKPFIYIAIFDF